MILKLVNLDPMTLGPTPRKFLIGCFCISQIYKIEFHIIKENAIWKGHQQRVKSGSFGGGRPSRQKKSDCDPLKGQFADRSDQKKRYPCAPQWRWSRRIYKKQIAQRPSWIQAWYYSPVPTHSLGLSSQQGWQARGLRDHWVQSSHQDKLSHKNTPNI